MKFNANDCPPLSSRIFLLIFWGLFCSVKSRIPVSGYLLTPSSYHKTRTILERWCLFYSVLCKCKITWHDLIAWLGSACRFYMKLESWYMCYCWPFAHSGHLFFTCFKKLMTNLFTMWYFCFDCLWFCVLWYIFVITLLTLFI